MKATIYAHRLEDTPTQGPKKGPKKEAENIIEHILTLLKAEPQMSVESYLSNVRYLCIGRVLRVKT